MTRQQSLTASMDLPKQIMPNHPVDFYDINGGSVNTTARAVDVIYLNYSQTFTMVSHIIL